MDKVGWNTVQLQKDPEKKRLALQVCVENFDELAMIQAVVELGQEIPEGKDGWRVFGKLDTFASCCARLKDGDWILAEVEGIPTYRVFDDAMLRTLYQKVEK